MTILLLLTGTIASAAPSGQIAFLSGTEQEDLWVCVLDLGSGEILRVGAGRRDGAPRWSPDGLWLAYPSEREGGMGIRVVRADGAEGRPLQHRFPWNHSPRWSPESDRLAYTASEGMDMKQQVIVYDLASDSEDTWGGAHEGVTGFLRPVWMPRLTMLEVLCNGGFLDTKNTDPALMLEEALQHGLIVAVGLPETQRGITTDLCLLTRTQAVPLLTKILDDTDRYVEWAAEPNRKGKRIAFESNDGGDREIFILDLRGALDVSNHRAADWNPVYGYDEQWLAFESFRGGRRGVYRLFPDTGRIFPVAASPEFDAWGPGWSPDGKWIVYVSDQSGNAELYIHDIKSGENTQVTHNSVSDYAPAWRPRSKD